MKNYLFFMFSLSLFAQEYTTGFKKNYEADGVNFNMVYVEGGLTTPTGADDKGTETIEKSYWIAETVITNKLWNKVKQWALNHGYKFSEGINGKDLSNSEINLNYPVTGVNWFDFMVFCNALTEWYNVNNKTNFTAVYYTDVEYQNIIKDVDHYAATSEITDELDFFYVKAGSDGFRIPTFFEWELASRYQGNHIRIGSIEKPEGSNKWWTPGSYASGALDDYNNINATKVVAWFTDNSQNSYHDVRTKEPNILGLYDMSGNVWEWVYGWSKGFGSNLKIRGGSCCYSDSETVSIGSILSINPYEKAYYTGARLARTNKE